MRRMWIRSSAWLGAALLLAALISGTFTFTARVTDSTGAQASQQFSITIS